MKKLFLYIDESKDFTTNNLYIGWLVANLGLHAMNIYCAEFVPTWLKYELKSTRKYERNLFVGLYDNMSPEWQIFWSKFFGLKEIPYESFLFVYVEKVLTHFPQCIEVDIFVDSIKIAPDVRKYQKTLSKRLSKATGKKISFEFKQSHEHVAIQFADLAVGIFRRKNEYKKVPLVDVS